MPPPLVSAIRFLSLKRYAACSKSALHLAAKKMQMRMEVRVAEKDKDNESDCDEDMDPIEPILDKHRGHSICNVSFTNLDLGNLVNGWPDDPIELRPFDCHFNPISDNSDLSV